MGVSIFMGRRYVFFFFSVVGLDLFSALGIGGSVMRCVTGLLAGFYMCASESADGFLFFLFSICVWFCI